MELVRGRSLDQVVAAGGPLPPSAAAAVGRQLLDALAAAHAAGCCTAT
jgi:serine/threonine protein kinase